ncbi:MAG: aspartate/glutamate racemase family protein [Janthinobacterium lividum]
MIDACRLALDTDRAEAIVLGCAGMGDFCEELREILHVPVVDGVTAAVKCAESLVALGLQTSKRRGFAAPLAKRYDGMLAAFGPENNPRMVPR